MITTENVTSSPRMGGRVHRYHTWPTITQQTVGEHTTHVMRIYWQVFGALPEPVALYLLFHDLPEVGTGDPPHMVKRDNPSMKQAYDDLEDQVLVSMVGHARAEEILGSVTEVERVRMKAADLLEMAEFAAMETEMGNKFAPAIMKNVMLAISKLHLHTDDAERVQTHVSDEVMRWVK